MPFMILLSVTPSTVSLFSRLKYLWLKLSQLGTAKYLPHSTPAVVPSAYLGTELPTKVENLIFQLEKRISTGQRPPSSLLLLYCLLGLTCPWTVASAGQDRLLWKYPASIKESFHLRIRVLEIIRQRPGTVSTSYLSGRKFHITLF